MASYCEYGKEFSVSIVVGDSFTDEKLLGSLDRLFLWNWLVCLVLQE